MKTFAFWLVADQNVLHVFEFIFQKRSKRSIKYSFYLLYLIKFKPLMIQKIETYVPLSDTYFLLLFCNLCWLHIAFVHFLNRMLGQDNMMFISELACVVGRTHMHTYTQQSKPTAPVGRWKKGWNWLQLLFIQNPLSIFNLFPLQTNHL